MASASHLIKRARPIVKREEGDVWLTLNVGGRHFECRKSTLITGAGAYFDKLFDGSQWRQNDDSTLLQLDRNADYFQVVLTFLRTGNIPWRQVHELWHLDMPMLRAEFDYFMLAPPVSIHWINQACSQQTPVARIYELDSRHSLSALSIAECLTGTGRGPLGYPVYIDETGTYDKTKGDAYKRLHNFMMPKSGQTMRADSRFHHLLCVNACLPDGTLFKPAERINDRIELFESLINHAVKQQLPVHLQGAQIVLMRVRVKMSLIQPTWAHIGSRLLVSHGHLQSRKLGELWYMNPGPMSFRCIYPDDTKVPPEGIFLSCSHFEEDAFSGDAWQSLDALIESGHVKAIESGTSFKKHDSVAEYVRSCCEDYPRSAAAFGHASDYYERDEFIATTCCDTSRVHTVYALDHTNQTIVTVLKMCGFFNATTLIQPSTVADGMSNAAHTAIDFTPAWRAEPELMLALQPALLRLVALQMHMSLKFDNYDENYIQNFSMSKGNMGREGHDFSFKCQTFLEMAPLY